MKQSGHEPVFKWDAGAMGIAFTSLTHSLFIEIFQGILPQVNFYRSPIHKTLSFRYYSWKVLKIAKTIHLVIFPASCVFHPVRNAMNPYFISFFSPRRCSCRLPLGNFWSWHRGVGDVFLTTWFTLQFWNFFSKISTILFFITLKNFKHMYFFSFSGHKKINLNPVVSIPFPSLS